MKASRYNILVQNDGTGTAILYNSLYGSLSICDSLEASSVRAILADPEHAAPYPQALKHSLTKQRFLVEDSLDELEIVKRRKIAGIEDPNRLDVVIMPTLHCNFACVYCFETARPSHMTDEVEDAIKAWVSREFPRRKVVIVSWYGGEPLLENSRVRSISKHCQAVAASSKVNCHLQIITNGYLLTRTIIEELVSCGIFAYQITVDGPPETHDRLRVLRNGKGTFDRIFQNIIELVHYDHRVMVSLRVNFNHTNLSSIPRLLHTFPEDVRPQLRVVYQPIFGCSSVSATDNLCSGSISEAMTEYYELAARLGYDVVLGLANVHTGKLVYCYAERENQVIINYNGDVYKCGVGSFPSEERVGYIGLDGVFVKETSRWNSWISASDLFEEKCEACAYLPLCMGGCRKVRLKKEGTGSYCSLVPTNSLHLLKRVALGGFAKVLMKDTTGEL